MWHNPKMWGSSILTRLSFHRTEISTYCAIIIEIKNCEICRSHDHRYYGHGLFGYDAMYFMGICLPNCTALRHVRPLSSIKKLLCLLQISGHPVPFGGNRGTSGHTIGYPCSKPTTILQFVMYCLSGV
jgi:hypothetical protein